MKKYITFFSIILMFISTLFVPKINVKAETISSIVSDNTELVDVKYYSGDIFNIGVLINSDLNQANIYKATAYDQQAYPYENYRFGSQKPYFNFNNSMDNDLFDNIIFKELFNNSLINLDNFSYNVLKHSNDGVDYGLVAFSKTITKNIYFDTTLDYIEFYVDHYETYYYTLTELNNLLSFSINIPLLVIDDTEYLGIRLNGKDNGFDLYTKNCILNIEKNYSDNNYGTANYIAKLTIPRVDYFKEISYTYFLDFDLSSIENGSITNEQLYKNKMYFAFSSEMASKFYDYPFDIISMNLEDNTITLNKTSYSNIYFRNLDYSREALYAVINGIGFEIIYSQDYLNYNNPESLCSYYQEKYPTYTCSLTNNNLASGDTLSVVQLRGFFDMTLSFDDDNGNRINSIYNEDEETKSIFYDEQYDLPFEFSNFNYNILYLNYSPYFDGIGASSEYSYKLDFQYVNYQKYTGSRNRTARTFYHKIKFNLSISKDYNTLIYHEPLPLLEKRTWKNDAMEWLIDFLDFEEYWYWQDIYFDMYFDEHRLNKIPNVNKIFFKYQKGFKEANKDDEYGFYFDDKYNGTSQAIKYQTIPVDPDYSTSGDWELAWSKDIEIDDNLSLEVHNDSFGDVEYNYRFTNYFKVDKKGGKEAQKKYINAFSPIEISYYTDELVTVPLVANSLGLHIEYDENGNGYVFDGEGIFRPDYSIFTTDDGFQFPGIDLNKDGVISENETVNSDTGIVEQKAPSLPDLGEIDDNSYKNLIDELLTGLGNLFKGIGNVVETIGIILGILLLITIYAYVISPLITWIRGLKNKEKKNISKRKKYRKRSR